MRRAPRRAYSASAATAAICAPAAAANARGSAAKTARVDPAADHARSKSEQARIHNHAQAVRRREMTQRRHAADFESGFRFDRRRVGFANCFADDGRDFGFVRARRARQQNDDGAPRIDADENQRFDDARGVAAQRRRRRARGRCVCGETAHGSVKPRRRQRVRHAADSRLPLQAAPGQSRIYSFNIRFSKLTSFATARATS